MHCGIVVQNRDLGRTNKNLNLHKSAERNGNRAMRIDHIGYAVKQMEQAIECFQELGFRFGDIIEDPDRKVSIAFGENDWGITVELVSPLEKGSPVDGTLRKNGNAPYHLCYQSANLEADIEQLEEKAFQVLIPPQKAVAFQGRKVAFLYHLQVGLIELVETDESA